MDTFPMRTFLICLLVMYRNLCIVKEQEKRYRLQKTSRRNSFELASFLSMRHSGKRHEVFVPFLASGMRAIWKRRQFPNSAGGGRKMPENDVRLLDEFRPCLKTGGMPDWGRFFWQARRFDAGILTDFKSNQRSPGRKKMPKDGVLPFFKQGLNGWIEFAAAYFCAGMASASILRRWSKPSLAGGAAFGPCAFRRLFS